MESGLRHEGYVIYYDGKEYVAEPFIPDTPVFEMCSQSVDRLISMIDELWATINNITSLNAVVHNPPPWLEPFLAGEFERRVNVDVAPWVYSKQHEFERFGINLTETLDNDLLLLDDIDTLEPEDVLMRRVHVREPMFQAYLMAKYESRKRARQENRRLTEGA